MCSREFPKRNPQFLGIFPKNFGDQRWGLDTRCWDSVGDIPAQITRRWDQAMVGALISGNLEISVEISEINLGTAPRLSPRFFEIPSRKSFRFRDSVF